ncbi:MAG TPA: hypothetical protein VHM64_07400 [Candidatus Binatia bacterium]|nr:hypothetical protein [Candidatus Binatia bacterium]
MARDVAVYRSAALFLAIALILGLSLQSEGADDLRRGQLRGATFIAAAIETDLDGSRLGSSSINESRLVSPPFPATSSWLRSAVYFPLASRKLYRMKLVFLI